LERPELVRLVPAHASSDLVGDVDRRAGRPEARGAVLVCMLIPVLRVISDLGIVHSGKSRAVTGRVVDEAGPARAALYRPAKRVIGLAVGELLYVRR
jgi:hypothetical protein